MTKGLSPTRCVCGPQTELVTYRHNYTDFPEGWGRCEYLIVAGSLTRAELRCGALAEDENCPGHQRFIDALAKYADVVLEGI